MGFYFRKSKSLGPFRFNFSKSGMGISTGVKGARVSTGPRGTFINVGRNGIYYRKKIGGPSQKRYDRKVEVNKYAYEMGQEVDSIMISNNPENESELHKQLINSINRAKFLKATRLVALFVLFCLFIRQSSGGWMLLILISFVFVLLLPIIFNSVFAAKVDYGLDSIAEEKWSSFLDSVEELRNNQKLWIVTTEISVYDRKKNAGASSSISRADATVKRIKPNRSNKLKFKTNVESLIISGGNTRILFLPSDVIIEKKGKLSVFSYRLLSIYTGNQSFIERQSVPKDATVIKYTWQYVNKNGTADMRFKNNKRIPVCSYGNIVLSCGNDLRIELQTSDNSTIREISSSFKAYKSYVNSLGLSSGVYGKDQASASTKQQSNPKTQQLYDDVMKSITDTGRAVLSSLEDFFKCKIKLLESGLIGSSLVFYYESEQNVRGMLSVIENSINSQTNDFKTRVRPVTDTTFLVYLDEALEESIKVDIPISNRLKEAMDIAKGDTIANKTITEALDHISNNSNSLFDERERLDKSDLFENDDIQDHKSGDDIVDDMFNYFDEE